MTLYIPDTQAALGFVTHQRTHIETQVLKKPYPAIRYSSLIPIDTSANPYAMSVTAFTQDSVGRPKLVNGKGGDVPLANIIGNKFEQMVHMGAIGYSFSLEEIGAAQMMGRSLSTDGADAARQSYEQFVDEIAFSGDSTVGIQGLFNTTGITAIAAAKTFAASTPDEILAAINNVLSNITSTSKGVEMADTVIMPIALFSQIATTRINAASGETVLEQIKRANLYTVMTGQPLTIEASARLDTRIVFYRRDPAVVKMHIPMPLQFIAPQSVELEIKVLGMFRFAPVSIRRPGAVRYLTGVA